MDLIDETRSAWKLGSVKLAALAGVLATILASNQSIALGLIYFLPVGPLRIVAAVAIGLVVFVIPTIKTMIERKNEAENGGQ